MGRKAPASKSWRRSNPMDHQNPTPPNASVDAPTTLQPSETPSQPLPAQPQSQPPPAASITTSSTSVSLLPSPNPNPVGNQNPNPSPNPIATQNPNPNPKPTTSLPSLQSPQQHPQSLASPAQTRPPATLSRTWQQSQFSHFSSTPSSSSSTGPLSSSPASPSISAPPPPRGGIAIGVPAHHPSPSPPQPAPFSSSYSPHFGGLGRGGVSLPEPASTSNALQVVALFYDMSLYPILEFSAEDRKQHWKKFEIIYLNFE